MVAQAHSHNHDHSQHPKLTDLTAQVRTPALGLTTCARKSQARAAVFHLLPSGSTPK